LRDLHITASIHVAIASSPRADPPRNRVIREADTYLIMDRFDGCHMGRAGD
jgi:hypothetical protein